MKRINKVKIFVIFISVATMLILSVLALVSERAAAKRYTAKIEPQVIEELENSGTTEIFVWLVERADLSAAVGFSSKAEKRQFVYDLVTASAGCTEDGGKIVCRIPYVTSGGTITIVIVLEPIEVADILMNQVTLASDSQDTYPEDNFDSESTMVLIEAEFLTLIPIVLR